jgi:hypothetical protein
VTPKRFVNAVLKTVVEGGVAMYEETLADPGSVTDPYWKRLLTLYRGLPPRQRKVVLEIMRQVQVDTVSELFGIFDGTSPLAGQSENFELLHKKGGGRVRLNGDLQDLFLEKIERLKKPNG